ncbi:MAG: hypothetical protein HFH68_08770 [Lachnospiraceae bacterium]|nr:hypothetical protein [Lachnospiraceae bacterium]
MKDYTNSSPVFSDRVDILETTDTNHADNFNQSTKQLLDNDLRLKNAINKCEKIEMLPAGQPSVTFSFDEGSIGENSRINIEASVSDVSYEAITVDGDNVTVVFEAQEKDIHVKAVVSDAVV